MPAQQHVGHDAVGCEDRAARVVRHVGEFPQEILRRQLEIALLALVFAPASSASSISR